MTEEGPRRGELPELVADHLLVDVHRHELLAVVNRERQADEVRQNGGAAAPGLDDPVRTTTRRTGGGSLRQQVLVDERAFLD